MRKSKYMIKMINIWAYGGQAPSDVSPARWNAICKFIQKNFDDLRIAPWQTQLYLYNGDIQHTTTTKENTMNFNEICLDAEMTRDEIYGLNVGNGETIFYTQEDDLFKQEQESEYRRLKRIKQENIENYRKQVDATGEFQYNGQTDEVSLHSNQQAFVGAMVKEGLIEFDDKF